MSGKFKSGHWLVLFAILACAALFNSAAAEEGSSYSVEGEIIRLVLDGFPNEQRRELADFRLYRTTKNTEPLKFSLSDLVDEDGRLFPRAMVFLTTPYDSNLQKITTSFNQTLLLASEDEYADLQLVALYNEEIRAGTYRGRLISPQGRDIPVEIAVNRYTQIAVEPQQIELQIPGPGLYQAKEPVEVTVWANHGDWVINLLSSGLFYQEEKAIKLGRSDREPVKPPLQLSLVGEKRQCLSEAVSVLGSEYGWGTTLSFRVETEAGWEHRAGNYAGVIKIEVSIQE